MKVRRWEDVTTIWAGPSYVDRALQFADSVEMRNLTSRITTCADVVDWDGDGRADILLGAKDGYVTFLRSNDDFRDDVPVFED